MQYEETFKIPPTRLSGFFVYIVLLLRVAEMMYCMENEAAGT